MGPIYRSRSSSNRKTFQRSAKLLSITLIIAINLNVDNKTFIGYSSGIQCCTQTQLGDMIDPNQQFVDPECLPIRIPNNDLIYNSLNESNTKTCMNFFRSQFHFRPNSQNNTSPPETAASNREQVNTF